MMSICIRRLVQTAAVIFMSANMFLLGSSAHGAEGIVVEGQLTKPNGTALESSVVTFRVQVRSTGAENCLMYEDTRSLDMSGSGGNFKLKLGDGGTPATSNTYTLREVFANRPVAFNFAAGLCASGSGFIPTTASTRNVVVSFQDGGTGAFEVLPPMNLGSVPYAIEAAQVGGFDATSLLRVLNGAGAPASLAPLSNTEYTKLTSLIAGTSTDYERSGRLNGLTLPTLSSGQIFEWTGSNWIGRNRLDGIQPFATTAPPNCTGQVLSSNGMNLTCVALPAGGSGNAPDGTSSVPSFSFASSPGTGIYQPIPNSIGFTSSGSEVARFASNGNFGIGTAAPQSKLHLFSPTAANFIQLQSPTAEAVIGLNSSVGFLFDTPLGHPLSFFSSGTERMRLQNGRLGIGTANPQGALHVANGAILGASTSVVTGSTIDFAAGNVRFTNSSCQAFTLYNLKPGSIYKFTVLGTTMSNCTFDAYSDSGSMPLTLLSSSPYAPNPGSRVIFTFTVLPNNSYIAEAAMF